MGLNKSQKRDMLIARDLIKKRQLSAAFKLIENIDHETAEKWRDQLQMLIDDDFGDPFSNEEQDESILKSDIKATNNYQRRRKWLILVGVIVLLVVSIGIFIQVVLVPAITTKYSEIAVKANTLQFIDSPNPSAMANEGAQWEYLETDEGTFHIVTYATAFSTASEGASKRSLTAQNQYRTFLEVGCNGERYRISIRASSEMSTIDNTLHVIMIFDDDDPQTVVLDPSDSREIAYFKDEMESVAFLELAQSGEFLVQMPTLTAYKFSKFNVSGFVTAVEPLISACGPLS